MSEIVQDFVGWLGKAPVAERIEAARTLAQGYLSSELNPAEREQIETAMTFLLDDGAVEVRLMLADALSRSEKAPVHVVMSLAHDAEVVATLIARNSPVILDSELVDMVAMSGEPMQLAVANRPFLSRAVCAALCEVATPAACYSLVQNRGARIPRFSLDRIVARHGGTPELRLALLERTDLPLDVRQVLLGRLAEDLRELIVSKDWTTPERAAAVTQDAAECATIAASFEAPAENIPALVAQLIEGKALTPAFLIRSVAAGQTVIFESALAMLAKVPQERVRALIASGRSGNLRALLQKSGLPPKTFPAFSAAIDVIRTGDATPDLNGDYRRATQLVDAIVNRYQKRPDRELDQILALLRRFARDAKRAAAREYMGQIRNAA